MTFNDLSTDETVKSALDLAVESALDTTFFYMKLEKPVTGYSTFSSIYIILSESFDGFKIEFRYRDLISKDLLKDFFEVIKPEVKKLLSKKWTYDRNQTEMDFVEDIAMVLKPFCRKIVLEKKHSVSDSFFSFEDIGMGSANTWHGTPDLRASPKDWTRFGQDSGDVAAQDDDIDIVIDDPVDIDPDTSGDTIDIEEDEESGDSIDIEAEVSIQKHLMHVRSQIVATTVVASFIKLNSQNVQMTPVILICKRRITVCFYDCVQDVLLYSEPVPLMVNDKLSATGLLFVSSVIHYR